MKKHKVGIIGCGAIFPRHLEAIKHNNNFELKAICDIQSHLVKSLAERLSVSAFTSYQDMIKSSDVDFVVIATPNSLHFERSVFALSLSC